MNRNTVLAQLGEAGKSKMIVSNQSVYDIIKLIKLKHGKCAGDYDKIALYFWKGSVPATCKYLWEFCKRYLPYKVESEETQTVSGPSAILQRAGSLDDKPETPGIDCKHFSLFIAGVLDSLTRQGYYFDWVYRFASYNPLDPTPGHVFIVVFYKGSEIWIDPVLDSFNYHKMFWTATDRNFSVSNYKATMSGIIMPVHVRSKSGLSSLKGHSVLQGIGTTAQTGQIIEKVSASVAAIPVYPVSSIVAAAGTLVGFFLATFGNKYTASTQVRL
jgi:hypothetical protein